MSVARYDLNKCIGCQSCVTVCPMDVFRFDRQANKSVIAYPENCQSCGQCFVYCKGHSLGIANETFGYVLNTARGLTSVAMNHQVMTERGVVESLSLGKLPGRRE